MKRLLCLLLGHAGPYIHVGGSGLGDIYQCPRCRHKWFLSNGR